MADNYLSTVFRLVEDSLDSVKHANSMDLKSMGRIAFALGTLITTTNLPAQEMRFVVEQSCLATGTGMNFKCDSRKGEFFITKSGSNFSGVHPDGGPKQSLSVVKATPHVVVLDYPVRYDGTSTVHLTDDYSKVYWISVAFSTHFNQREVSIVSGRRLK